MDKKEAEKQMQRIVDNSGNDTEAEHSNADDILCELLKSLGYRKLIKLYKDIYKWYA